MEANQNQNSTQPGGVSPTPYEEAKEQKQKMIKKMLYLGYEMGYDAPRSPAQKVMERRRVNWNNVESWCMSKHCSVNKGLKRMSVIELNKVLTQFEAVHKSFVNEYNKAG